MKERIRHQAMGLGVALAIASVVASTSACHDSKKDTPVADAGPTSAVMPPVASETASAAPAARPPDTEVDDAPDAGDGHVRLKRRLLAAAVDAGAADTTTAPAPTTAATASAATSGKRPPAPMENDQVYGASAASAAPALRKKPLLNDDPWTSNAGSPR